MSLPQWTLKAVRWGLQQRGVRRRAEPGDVAVGPFLLPSDPDAPRGFGVSPMPVTEGFRVRQLTTEVLQVALWWMDNPDEAPPPDRMATSHQRLGVRLFRVAESDLRKAFEDVVS